jgi:hypothetical protein
VNRPSLLLAGLSVVGAIVLIWFALLVPTQGGFGYDAYAFWDVRLDDIYGRSFGQLTAHGAFRYSPPIAVLFAPFHLLPWPVFLAIWTAALGVVLVWLGGRWAVACCAFIGVPMSIYEGNVDLLIAASVALGLRWPAVLSFAILAKLTPGVVLIWFVVTRDWRSLWIALAATGLLVALTYPFVDDAWPRYVEMLIDNGRTVDADTTVVRSALAVALIVWAALTKRPWVVGVAAAIAQPVVTLRSLTVGLSALALFRRARSAPRSCSSAEVARPL